LSKGGQVRLSAIPSLGFWPSVAYTDATPAGQIVYFDSHRNALIDPDTLRLLARYSPNEHCAPFDLHLSLVNACQGGVKPGSSGAQNAVFIILPR
jgi:hypothetical protein